jgi:tRNA threonylcarbamoyladenosine biosynthesis protein TsaB
MRMLALDTATEACSVALLTDDGLFSRFAEVGRGHAEAILSMVDATLAEAGVRLGMLDAIAASVGPGAFTGIRICVSVAQGLAFGAGLPVVPVTTLEALALQAMRGGATHVMACLDARMGEVYWGCFSADATRGLIQQAPLAVGAAASVVPPFGGAAFQGIGRGFAAYAELAALPGLSLPCGAAEALPDARDMATLGAIRCRAGQALDAAELTPQYLRDKVASTEAERAALRETAAAAASADANTAK